MKRAIIAIFMLVAPAMADQIDKVVDDAIRHGAHGMTRAQMREWADAGLNYEPRDNSWTDEKVYNPAHHGERLHYWLYFNNCGAIWVDGELREYVRSRGLMQGGHRYMVDGHTVFQVQLTSGEWVNVWPER